MEKTALRPQWPKAVRSFRPDTSHAQTLAERGYARLKEALIVGRFTPGQRITLRTLGGQLGMGVTPAREAIIRLSAASALECREYHNIRLPVLTPADLNELRHLRWALESLAMHETGLEALDLAQMRQRHKSVCVAVHSEDPTQFARALWSFRTSMLSLQGHTVLSPLIDRVWCRLGPTFTQSLDEAPARRRVLCAYSELLAAIEQRHPARVERALEREIHLSTYIARLHEADRTERHDGGAGL